MTLIFFCTGPNLNELIDNINNELVHVVDWLSANKMSLNIEKTHYMVFCNRGRSFSLNSDVRIAGTNIERVNHTKFLGIIIDSKLSWKFHIDHVCSKISKNIGIIQKCRKIFNKDTLITL